MKLNFYKDEDYRWYVDLPDTPFSKEELEMVEGADMLLDVIAQGEYFVTATINDKDDEITPYKTALLKIHENEFGATYAVDAICGIEYPHLTVWLCPVTLYLFSSYPNNLYLNY